MISPLSSGHTLPQPSEYLPCLSKLKALYAEMDRQYEHAASHYGFICSGCDDNCCRTRFYHHTFLEYLYIIDGFNRLSAEIKRETRNRARKVCNQMNEENTPFGQMCPLNFEGRCILYIHRPMICRLHGIPHELRKYSKALLQVKIFQQGIMIEAGSTAVIITSITNKAVEACSFPVLSVHLIINIS